MYAPCARNSLANVCSTRSGVELVVLKGRILCSDCFNQDDGKN